MSAAPHRSSRPDHAADLLTDGACDPSAAPANEAPASPAPARGRPVIDAAQYLDFVRRVASRMARNLPSHVSLDDLIGAGSLGLLDAMDRYDPSKAERFETFAEFRVKGAILDELRRYDLMARNARLTAKRMARKSHELTARHGRPPTEAEIGQVRVLSLDDVSGSDDGANDRSFELRCKNAGPEDAASQRQLLEHLDEAVEQLPARQQMILEMYYQRDTTLKEIGRQVGVTESRVCQIMGEATRQLRSMLRERRRAA